MKYWCEHCECVVEPRYVKVEEIHYEVDTRCTEEWEQTVCPKCGHEVEEASTCEICGEATPPRQNICEWCADTVRTEYEAMISKIAEDFHVNEKTAEDYLNDWYAEYKE